MQRLELKPHVTLTYEQTEKYKTSFLTVNMIRPLCEEEASMNALLPSVLLRGTESTPDIERICAKLDELYGAGIHALVRKKGEVQCVGIGADFVEDRFTTDGSDILRRMTEYLREFLFCPVLENGIFRADYVESEKVNLIRAIESSLNDKRIYSALRLQQIMCAGEAYGIPRLGSVAGAEKITAEALFRHYRHILQTSKYEIFFSGSAPLSKVEPLVRDMMRDITIDAPVPYGTKPVQKAGPLRVITEHLDVTQAKMTMGFRMGLTCDDPGYPAFVLMNAVFGAGITSKLFQNVREKQSLCYYASSTYEQMKGIFYIATGVAEENLEIAKEAILKELDDCKNGVISDEEFENARKAVLSALYSGLDSAGRIENYMLGRTISGKTDTMEDLIAAVEQVRKEDLPAAAQSLVPDTFFLLKGEPSCSE